MAQALRFDHDTSRRTLPAGLLSIAAHLCLLWGIATRAQLLPSTQPLAPLRFIGQTFDIDALGDDFQNEARPVSDDSQRSAAAPLKEEPPETKVDVKGGAREPESDPEAKTAPVVHEPAPPPRPSKAQDVPAKEEVKRPASPPQAPKKPVDPFDLAVPGDSSSSAAPSTPSETGSYGAEGSEAPVTDVFKAFLHLFPEANRHNPAWKALPLGPVGRIEFSLLIGKNARLVSIEIHEKGTAPPPKILIDAIRMTQSYLIHQRLGWEGERREGRQRLALTIQVQKKAPHATTPEREGSQRHGRYGEARPTGAFFTYYDGQHIDIELERVSSDTLGP